MQSQKQHLRFTGKVLPAGSALRAKGGHGQKASPGGVETGSWLVSNLERSNHYEITSNI